jgi:hypothetical protein
MKVLKPIGHDRDALTIMTKKGELMRIHADRTSEAFENCGTICQTSLVSLQDLQMKTNDFVQIGIRGAQNDAQDLIKDYDRKKKDLQISIDQKGVDVSGVEFEASRARERANDLERQENQARRAANKSKGVR